MALEDITRLQQQLPMYSSPYEALKCLAPMGLQFIEAGAAITTASKNRVVFEKILAVLKDQFAPITVFAPNDEAVKPILEYFNKHYFSEQAFLNSTKLFPDFRAGNLILNSKVTTQQFPAYPGYLVVETIAEPSSFDTRAVTQLDGEYLTAPKAGDLLQASSRKYAAKVIQKDVTAGKGVIQVVNGYGRRL